MPNRQRGYQQYLADVRALSRRLDISFGEAREIRSSRDLNQLLAASVAEGQSEVTFNLRDRVNQGLLPDPSTVWRKGDVFMTVTIREYQTIEGERRVVGETQELMSFSANADRDTWWRNYHAAIREFHLEGRETGTDPDISIDFSAGPE